ncbi:hypothetical protein BH11MYX1_BH11MYX1_13670 [soil metagenome]
MLLRLEGRSLADRNLAEPMRQLPDRPVSPTMIREWATAPVHGFLAARPSGTARCSANWMTSRRLALAVAWLLCVMPGCASEHAGLPASDGSVSATDAGAIDDGAVPDAAPSTARIYTHFNWPLAHASGLDPTITNELVRMINATPSGEVIHGNFFGLSHPVVAAALNAAYDRGVIMRITLDGSPANRAAAPAISVASHMGTSAGFCGGTDPTTQSLGCITSAVAGIAHIKFLTFSRTKAPNGVSYPNVVWFGSYNAGPTGSGDGDSNSATSVYNSQVSYDELTAHQIRMQHQVHYPSNDYYDRPAGRGYFYDANAGIEAHLSPESGPNLVFDQLLRITPDTSCVIRVFQAVVSDSVMPAVQRLIALQNKIGGVRHGCQVFVLATFVGTAAMKALSDAGIEIRHLTKVHDKLFMIDGKYDGSAVNRKLVFTGSHNWENKSSYGNDELLASVENAAQYQLFYAHFLAGWQVGTH